MLAKNFAGLYVSGHGLRGSNPWGCHHSPRRCQRTQTCSKHPNTVSGLQQYGTLEELLGTSDHIC